MRRNPLPKKTDNEPIQFIDQVNRNEDLSGEDLRNANLKGSDFTSCSFRNADLRNAILVDCNLTDCDFTNADLSGAVLVGATVENANFDSCFVSNTMLFEIEKLNTVKRFVPKARFYELLGGFVFTISKIKDASNYDQFPSIFYNSLATEINIKVLNEIVFDYVFNLEVLNFAKGRDILLFNEIKDYIISDGKCFCFLKHSPFKNLKGANLQDANFEKAYLFEANLQHASLRDANLKNAYLIKADLQGADLHGADLHGADLIDANLQGADLQSASCMFANFRGANLRGANFRGANILYAIFPFADLTGATYNSETRLSDQYIKIRDSMIFVEKRTKQ